MSEGLMAPEARLRVELPNGGATHGAAIATRRTAESPVEQAVSRTVKWMLSAQSQEGYWWGELEADTTLESDYILYLHILGDLESAKTRKLAKYIRDRQLPDGGWNIFYGGPAELNATVKAWVGLRLAGDAANSPHLERARARIHELGGLEATNSYTRFYLAMVGAIDWDFVPAIPPELMLLPDWFPINLYEMSSWTRGIVIPLAIVYAYKPAWRLPAGLTVEELFRHPGARPPSLDWDRRVVSWKNVFLALGRAVKVYEKLSWLPFRKLSLSLARNWMLERLERSEGLGTIYPAMMNSIFALAASRWLVDNQILGPGDWQVTNRDAEPGGWAFEFRNDYYPDVDDTAFVLMALGRVEDPEPVRLRASIRRGMAWLVSMQNEDGGWGAFDHENNLEFLNNVPFADHNAMLDPSTADVTARALECLGQMGWPATHPAVARGRAFVRHEQESDGSWFGRWGVNYVYGTSGVLRALETLGLGSTEECKRAAEWLKSVQNTDGGFGESILSYYDKTLKAKGKSTASQTAWGVIGLMAVVGADDPAVERAVDWIVSHQNDDGSWEEPEFTGTGFPQRFFLKYHLYRNSFPLYALGRYENLRNGRERYIGVQVAAEDLQWADPS